MPGSISPLYRDGGSIPGFYPLFQGAVLQSVAAASGVPAPNGLAASVVPLSPANSTVSLLGANPNRSFLLIYNPTQMPAQFSKGIARQGAISNLSIGPGQAYFWATAQGLGSVYQGALTAVGLLSPLPLWVWEDNGLFYNDGGVLALHTDPGWPTSPVGLPAGAVWNNGLTVGVVPGIIPNPNVPPLFFGSVTAEMLLASGGGNLPTSPPTSGSLQLWNDGGMVGIA